MTGILSRRAPPRGAGAERIRPAAPPPSGSPARVVRVALAGCGVVGGGVVALLRDRAEEVERRHGLRFELVRVLVRRGEVPRPGVGPELLTTAVEELLRAEADVVVEAIGGVDAALAIARAVLGRGGRLVTANKSLVAAHGAELAALARGTGGTLDFEAAVGGGVPVVRALRESLAGSGIEAVRGILNGTTNHLLTRMAGGVPFEEALREARERGFAEADPSRDLSGRDAAEKLAILAWLCFGADPARVRVRRRGLPATPDRLAADAAAAGGVPRLLAECVRTGGGIAAAVEPAIVDPRSELGRTPGEENVALVASRWNGVVRLAGPGAGPGPTASALLGDLLRPALPVPPVGSVRVVPDHRLHRWVVSARMAPAELGAVLEGAGVRSRPLAGDREVARVVTGPAPWPRLAAVLRVLAEGGGEPVAARSELAEPGPPS